MKIVFACVMMCLVIKRIVKKLIIFQVNNLSEEPQLEMGPSESSSHLEVTNNQYTNVFQPVINGSSGSAPHTPAASPLATLDANIDVSSVQQTSTTKTSDMESLGSYDANNAAFVNGSVVNAFNVPIEHLVPVSVVTDTNSLTSHSPDGQLLGVEPALQEQLLNAIPPPSKFQSGPFPTDESGVPSTLPGEFPLSES